MKALVIFYSRTGTTKKLAEEISKNLKCDIEEIFDTKDRLGFIGYLIGGKDALFKKFTKLQPIKKDPSKYQLVILGTPVWALTITPAIRTYIYENRDKFNKVAFFCTQGGSGNKNKFIDMEYICNKKPIATLELTTKDIINNTYSEKLKEFILVISKK